MKDPRISWIHQIYQKENGDLDSENHSKKWSINEQIGEWLAIWCKEFVIKNRNFSPAKKINLSFNKTLLAKTKKLCSLNNEFNEFFKYFEKWILRTTQGDLRSQAVAKVITKLLVGELIKNQIYFDLVFQLFSDRGAIRPFEDKLLEVIKELSIKDRQKWIQYLKNIKNQPFSLVEFFKGEEAWLHCLLEDKVHQKNTILTFDLVWNSYHRNRLRGKESSIRRLRLLCALDFKEFLKLFDNIPAFEIQGMIFQEIQIEHDRDLILEWIKYAPQAMDNEKNTCSSTILFGINAVVEYARAVQHSVSYCANSQHIGPVNQQLIQQALNEKQKLEEDELSKWFFEAFSFVLKRSDGLFLLLDFALELIHRSIYMAQSNNKETWNAERATIKAIAELFSNYSNFIQEVRSRAKYLKDKKEGRARVSPGNLLLLAVLSRKDDGESAELLWEWYSELIYQQDDSLLSHVSEFRQTEEWVFNLIGTPITQIKQPAIKIEELWERLYLLRFQAHFKLGLPSELNSCRHLLRVILGALNTLFMRECRDQKLEKELWELVSKIARTLYFSHAGSIHTDYTSDVDRVFCYVPNAYSNDWPNVIESWRLVLGNDSELCIRIANALVRNHIPAAEVKSVFEEKGLNLQKMVSQVEDWYLASGDLKKIPFDLTSIKNNFLTTKN